VRLANQAIDDCRRRIQQATLGHRGRQIDPLDRIRRTLLVGHERLNDHQRERIVRLIGIGDRDGEVAAAYLAKDRADRGRILTTKDLVSRLAAVSRPVRRIPAS
jgi:hypothetical protein